MRDIWKAIFANGWIVYMVLALVMSLWMILWALPHIGDGLPPGPVRPQSALVPTLQYLTTADLNDLRTAMINHSAQIADLRAANKSLAAELSARIDPLEAALKSMQITIVFFMNALSN